MTTNDQTIEAQIQAKGLIAPRVTPADIDEKAARDSEISRLAVFIDSNPVFPPVASRRASPAAPPARCDARAVRDLGRAHRQLLSPPARPGRLPGQLPENTMTLSREMPKYQCHKQVWALKIKEISHKPNPDTTGGSAAASYGAVITPADDGYSPFDVPAEFVTKHKPQAGGYFVVYDDGYKSYSPAAAFESGYSLIG